MPALANAIAMPPPMVPAPTIPALAISRAGVSSGSPGILPTARSPKKAWRSAFDSGPSMSSSKQRRSTFTPSSKGSLTAASTASMHFAGAG
jgi:hypothetical protein